MSTEFDPSDRALLAARAEEAIGGGSWELDLASGTQAWSDNYFRLLGLEVGDIEPSLANLLSRVHPDDSEEVERFFSQLDDAGALARTEFRVVAVSGEVRHLHITLAITDRRDGLALRAIGSVQDVTDQRRAEREVTAHLAILGALRDWTSLRERGPGLLRDLARAFDAGAGVIWIPDRDVLVAHSIWASRAYDAEDFIAASRRAHLPRGSGLPGRAWKACEPVGVKAGDYDDGRARSALGLGLRNGIAFPALHDGGALAVVELLAGEQIEMNESLKLSLTAIGHQLGGFLSQHRGEIIKHLLTARELECLQLAARGAAGPEISERLGIRPSTVKSHFDNVYSKLGVEHRSAAVAAALRLGLID